MLSSISNVSPMRTIFLASALLLATSATQAQATWHNLQFGDTRDNIRAKLNAEGIPTEVSQEGTLQATGDYDIFLPGLSHTLPLLTSYHFTPAGTLMDVTLTLDLPAMRRLWSDAPVADDLADFAAQHLGGALAGRYGAPLYRSPSCDTPGKEPSTCVVFWNGPEQSIALEHRGPLVFVRYQMLATDL